ncbi:DUF4058 family protein [Chloroflexi bacterium TSY]|nr:DUF4058 family protein [Chloroflexi bacterium TSY]
MNNQTDYPFPGMDPWLEHPGLWGDVHFRLIGALANYLSPLLTPHYYVAVGTHAYISTPPQTPTTQILDVAVVESASGGIVASSTAGMTDVPVMVEVPVPDIMEDAYLEIKQPGSGEVITSIEVLSYYNKSTGAGREKYLRKRLEIFSTQTHLIEIDLLRSGTPMPFLGTAKPKHYRILIRRGEEGSRARLYPFDVQEPIPHFPVPLQAGDTEPIVDLGKLLRQIYVEASYHLRVDYQLPPTPTLSDNNQKWVTQVLTSTTSPTR